MPVNRSLTDLFPLGDRLPVFKHQCAQGVAFIELRRGSRFRTGDGVDSEDETLWRAFLLSLKRRGLAGVPLVISDQHSGLVAAFKRSFQGSAH